MLVGTVAQLWRYPVKSLRGHQLDFAVVGPRGIAWDRCFALVDRETGHVASAKRPRLWGRLLECAADIVSAPGPGISPPGLRITLPGGRTVTAGDAVADEVLTDLLSRPVTLVSRPPEQATIERYWPDIEGLEMRDAVTANEIGLGAPPGTFFDYAPLHLLTSASLEHLRQLYPGDAAVHRFRPNVLITPSAHSTGFLENAWVGHLLAIGDAVRLRVTNPTPRCVVPTLPQPGLPLDLGILRAIAQHNRPPVPALGGATMPSFGVYAAIEQGGTLRLGAEVRMVMDR